MKGKKVFKSILALVLTASFVCSPLCDVLSAVVVAGEVEEEVKLKVVESENYMVTGVTLDNDEITPEQDGTYRIDSGTEEDSEIKITYTCMPAYKGGEKSVYVSTSTDDSNVIRTYTYAVSVRDIADKEADADTGIVTVAPDIENNDTYTIRCSNEDSKLEWFEFDIPEVWKVDTYEYYIPVEEETFTIRVTSPEGYVITNDNGCIDKPGQSSTEMTWVDIEISAAKYDFQIIAEKSDITNLAGRLEPETSDEEKVNWSSDENGNTIVYFDNNSNESSGIFWHISETPIEDPSSITNWIYGGVKDEGTGKYKIEFNTILEQTAGNAEINQEKYYMYGCYITSAAPQKYSNIQAFEIYFDQTAPTVIADSVRLVIGTEEKDHTVENYVDSEMKDQVYIRTKWEATGSGIDRVEYGYPGDDDTVVPFGTLYATDQPLSCVFDIPIDSTTKDKTLVLMVYDYVDNGERLEIDTDTYTKKLLYDTTAPIINSVTITNANGEALNKDKWQTEDVTVTITPEDKVGDTGETVSDLASICVVNKDTEAEIATEKQNDGTYSFELTESGIYNLVIIAKDKAGNISEAYETTVKIDKGSPVITLSGVETNGIYHSDCTLQVQVAENMWLEMSAVSITGTYTLDGITTELDLEGYKLTAATDQFSREFSEDGVYSVTVSAVDVAGNKDEKTITFTIDKTAPVLSITGVPEGGYSRYPVTLDFQSIESFYETNEVKIDVERTLDGVTDKTTLVFENEKTGKISTLSKEFTENGAYTIIMTARDQAGNEAEPQKVSFTVDIDREGPTITGQEILNTQPVSSDNWVNIENQYACVIKITATDAKSKVAKIVYHIDDGAEITMAYDEARGYFEIPYDITGKGTALTYTVYDSENNSTEATIDLSNIKFDFTRPMVQVAYEDADGKVLAGEALEGWQTTDTKVIVTLQDGMPVSETGEEVSGMHITTPIVIKDGDGTVIPYTIKDGNYIIILTSDGVHELNIVAYDNAGNSSETYTSTIKLDKTGVQNLSVKLSTSPELEDASQFAEEFTIYANSDSKSGIREVRFSLYERGTDKLLAEHIATGASITNTGENYSAEYKMSLDTIEELNGYVIVQFVDNAAKNISVADNKHVVNSEKKVFAFNKKGAAISILGNTNWTNGDVTLNIHVESKSTTITKIQYLVNGKEVKTIENINSLVYTDHEFTLSESSFIDGTQIEVVATCGANEHSFIETRGTAIVRIDKQVPSIRFAGIAEGAIYNSNQILQIVATDNIWQAMKPVSVTATRTIDGNTTELDLGSYNVESASYIATKAFSEDGIYTVTVNAVDAAGNADVKQISFIIDKTAPVLSMTGAMEGAYSSIPITINFQVIESFFDTNSVGISVKRKLEGSTYERTINFANIGKTSNLSNTFAEDGDYTLTMTAIDRAGNVAIAQTLSFTIDCTAPAVALAGTNDYFVTDQPVTLDFSVIESYFATNRVQIQGSRRLASGKTEVINIMGWNNSGRISALTQEFTEDGYYTITISATDKAGNSKNQTIHFTIDTEAPVIGDLSRYDGKYLSSFELTESIEELISELSVPNVKMTLNGEAYDGSEVTEEGKYTLVLEVADEVGLTTTETIEFVIDKTSPKIIFAGVEDKKTYTEEVRLNLSLENEKDTIVKILINGESYELTEGQVSYDLSFDEFGDYEIVILTIDEAGNENSQSIQFTYAEHKRILLLWVLIAAVLAAAGLMIFMVIRYKKNKD